MFEGTLAAFAICFAAILVLSNFGLLEQTTTPSTEPPQLVRQQDSPSDPYQLDQEHKKRIQNLIRNGSVVVTGTIGQGVPTGDNYAYIFTPRQILKGQAAYLKVILSRSKPRQESDFFETGTSNLTFPKLAPGEYMLVLRADEVAPMSRTYQNGPFNSPEQTFNYFISNDDKQLAAWPIDSPHYKYAWENYMQATQSQANGSDR